MTDFAQLTVGAIETNCYMIKVGRQSGFVIDPGDDFSLISAKLSEMGINDGFVLLTHGHADHLLTARELQESGFKIVISKNDYELSKDDRSVPFFIGHKINHFMPDILVESDGDLNLLDVDIKVMFTPGHTEGSVCYIIDGMLFSGDTLFFESIGRTDLATGNYKKIIDSLKRILSLPGDMPVYPGHGIMTTLSHEREYNPYAQL